MTPTPSLRMMVGRGLRHLGRLLVVVIVLLIWLPAFVFVAGLTVTNLTGCRVTEAGAQPCLVAGTDIGHDLYGMLMMGWIVIALLPLMLATVIAAVAWGAIRLILARRRAAGAAITRDGAAQNPDEERSSLWRQEAKPSWGSSSVTLAPRLELRSDAAAVSLRRSLR